MTNELSLLQTVRLKGRVRIDLLAAALETDIGHAQTSIDLALSSKLVIAAGEAFKLTPAGRERLTELMDAERKSIDTAALEPLYHEFDGFNTELKALITRWQMTEPDSPNDHSDAAYDAAVIEELAALHRRFGDWLRRLATINPRLSAFQGRFAAALAAVQAGDHSFIAKPIANSYHTVWFELHEELIGLLGRNRADEAAAGRAH